MPEGQLRGGCSSACAHPGQLHTWFLVWRNRIPAGNTLRLCQLVTLVPFPCTASDFFVSLAPFPALLGSTHG
ncbi:hypothetical protein Nmel_017818 [Mimus melanotis]